MIQVQVKRDIKSRKVSGFSNLELEEGNNKKEKGKHQQKNTGGNPTH